MWGSHSAITRPLLTAQCARSAARACNLCSTAAAGAAESEACSHGHTVLGLRNMEATYNVIFRRGCRETSLFHEATDGCCHVGGGGGRVNSRRCKLCHDPGTIAAQAKAHCFLHVKATTWAMLQPAGEPAATAA